VKLAVLVAAAAVAGAIVALVVAINGTQDNVPQELKDCLRNGGARVVRGPEGLAVAHADIASGRLRNGARTKVGDDVAVLLHRTGYSVLVLRSPQNPPLSRDVGADALLRTPAYAVVAVESAPVHDVLAGCVERVRGKP
jgi:hypothetical protein